mmetsp:Transcript_75052/g.160816  ORF Transcript_75052/g.160816 Transcript_75052/m.160816 type:complete len:221 (+) Transcript_75052:542-1204(+)
MGRLELPALRLRLSALLLQKSEFRPGLPETTGHLRDRALELIVLVHELLAELRCLPAFPSQLLIQPLFRLVRASELGDALLADLLPELPILCEERLALPHQSQPARQFLIEAVGLELLTKLVYLLVLLTGLLAEKKHLHVLRGVHESSPHRSAGDVTVGTEHVGGHAPKLAHFGLLPNEAGQVDALARPVLLNFPLVLAIGRPAHGRRCHWTVPNSRQRP